MSDQVDIQEDQTPPEAPEEAAEDARLALFREIVALLHESDVAGLKRLIEGVHAADLADIISQMERQDRKDFIAAVKEEIDPDVLWELEGEAQEDVRSVLAPRELAEAVSQLETDEAVAVLEEMEPEDQDEVLKKIAREDRLVIKEALSFPEDSAGRLMQRDLVAVPPYWTVGQTIDYLRDQEDLPDEFYEIFVVDPKFLPIGTVPLSRVMRTRRPATIEEIMDTEQTLIPVDMDQEEVAYKFRQYNLVSAAVVDGSDRLVGVITVDDIVDVIEEEAEEDILALAGVSEGDLNVPILSTTRTRFGWLLVNLLTAILASIVIGLFGGSIEQMVALAVLMPIVASMGGNAGTQTMTVAVRAMATKELTAANAFRIVNKELLVSLINGVLLAVIMGVIAALWFSSPGLGSVIGAAMVINLLVAGLAGILIPLALDRAGIDPAVASTVFVTTVTDVIGFFVFLGLAALYLLH